MVGRSPIFSVLWGWRYHSPGLGPLFIPSRHPVGQSQRDPDNRSALPTIAQDRGGSGSPCMCLGCAQALHTLRTRGRQPRGEGVRKWWPGGIGGLIGPERFFCKRALPRGQGISSSRALPAVGRTLVIPACALLEK